MVTRLALGLFVLHNSFPWLTVELRGCVYYCQHLTVVAVSLVYVLFPVVIDLNKRHPQMVATQKYAVSSHVICLKKYGSSFFLEIVLDRPLLSQSRDN